MDKEGLSLAGKQRVIIGRDSRTQKGAAVAVYGWTARAKRGGRENIKRDIARNKVPYKCL